MVKKEEELIVEYKNLIEMLETAGRGSKGITFINDDNQENTITYCDLYNKARKVLYPMQQKGIAENSELILLLNDNEAFLNSIWAAFMGKFIAVPTPVGLNEEFMFKLVKVWQKLDDPHLLTTRKIFFLITEFAKKNNMAHLIDVLAARTLFYEELDQNAEPGVIKECLPDDVAMVQFSSGSTGDPKGVILTHMNLLINVRAIMVTCNATVDDSTLSWVPLTHDFGLVGFHFIPMFRIANQVLMSISLFLKNPLVWLERVSKHRPTLLSCPNFGFKHYLNFYQKAQNVNLDLSSVRLIFNGAEPISATLCNIFMSEMAKFGMVKNAMYPVYGLAEATLAVAFPVAGEGVTSVKVDRNSLTINQKVVEMTGENEAQAVEFVDLGYSLINIEYRVVDENNNVVDDYVVGYIQIKGPTVTQGYYKNPEATEKLFTPDGWAHTGDVGFVRNKRLVITGRAKEIIFVNGQNYYPHDLERLSSVVPGVDVGNIIYCGVYNDKTNKEEILAFIQFDRDIKDFISTRNKLKTHIMRQIGLDIEEVVPVPVFPKTASGKVQRFRLAEMYKNGEFAHIVSALREVAATYVETKEIELPKTELEEQLINICKEVLNVESIGTTNNILEYGSSSIILTQMHQRLEALFPGKVKITDFFKYPTIAQMAKLIESENEFKLRGMELPAEYFGYSADKAVFKYTVEGELLKSLATMAQESAVAVKDILLSGLVFTMKEITEQEEVTVQVLTDYLGFLTSLEINFTKEYPDFKSLFQDVKARVEARDSQKMYSYYDLESLNPAKGKTTVLPLFYEKVHVTKEVNLFDYYDLTLELVQEPETIEIAFGFNAKRLQKDMVKELFESYLECIHLLIDNF